MIKDLHSYLTELERDHPEEVLHIHSEIDGAYEATAVVSQLEKEGKHPVLVFHNITTPSGSKSKFPVVTNLLSSRRRCARAIGSSAEKVGIDYLRKASDERIAAVPVNREVAPVKQVVKKGDQVDLYDFPALVHHVTDPGPYFTGGYLTSFDIDSGIDNSALQRGWLKSGREVRMLLGSHSHNFINLRKHESVNRDMKVALWMGHHPAALLGAQARFSYPWSHYAAAGGVLGEPLRVVPSETLGDDFLVPADAEIVVEGIMKAHKRVAEGPFGEFTGYVGPQVAGPYLEVTAVTHRENACWHDIQVGYAENRLMMAMAIEGSLADSLKRKIPSFANVHVPLSAVCFHAYVQLRNPQPGEARDAIMCAVEGQPVVKHVFVVDEDVDIFNEKEVLWALATRTQWDDDVMIFRGLRGTTLDPSIPESVTAKSGVDCTRPAGEPYSERSRVPQEVYERVRLADCIGLDRLANVPVERQ